MGKDKRTSGGPNKQAGETGHNLGGNLGLPFCQERKIKFCEELLKCNCVYQVAARKIGVCRVTVAKHLKKYPEFKQMVEDTKEEYRASLVGEAHRRGVQGTPKFIYFQGERVMEEDEDGEMAPAITREYDTTLLMALLKRYVPGFSDKMTIENKNMNVDMGVKDLETMTPEQRGKLREMMDLEPEEGGDDE